MSVSPPALVGAARAGGCNTVEVRVRNTSTQVEVRGPWTVRLEVLDSEGEKLSERIEERLGLGHRWDKEGLSDKAAVRFESVELPAPGDYRLRARAALVSSAQKEYAAHDNTAEREVAVAADCASAAGGEQ